MDKVTDSKSALDKFVEKIDFAKLTGKPNDFFEAGQAFMEKGQFDDAIIEFVKIIKTVSHQKSLFSESEKSLKSMGFSTADIHTIAGIKVIMENNQNSKSQEEKMEQTPKEKLGKLILNIGNIPAILVGGLLLIGGLLLFLTSTGNQTEGAMVDPAGFGSLIGLLALVPGIVILGLWYLSRLGPRNPSLTILGISSNLLIGLAAVLYLINSTLTTNGIILQQFPV